MNMIEYDGIHNMFDLWAMKHTIIWLVQQNDDTNDEKHT